MTDIADTAINGVPNYDMYVMSMFEAMEFRGKPLSTWEQELNFNELGDRIDHNELKAYNLDFINKSRIILNNLSFAKSSLKACEMHYTIELANAKNDVIEEWTSTHPGSRLPSVDAINNKASSKCIESFVAKEIAEMFLLFWQSQYEKVKIIDSRLQGLGYLQGLEARNTHI